MRSAVATLDRVYRFRQAQQRLREAEYGKALSMLQEIREAIAVNSAQSARTQQELLDAASQGDRLLWGICEQSLTLGACRHQQFTQAMQPAEAKVAQQLAALRQATLASEQAAQLHADALEQLQGREDKAQQAASDDRHAARRHWLALVGNRA